MTLLGMCKDGLRAVKPAIRRVIGQQDIHSFVRLKKLALKKRLYRRPIAVEDFRGMLRTVGFEKGRTVWVQTSWNDFYNLKIRPLEVIEMMRELIGPDGTLVMPAFPLDQDPSREFRVASSPVNTGLLCELFRRYPGVVRSIHLRSSVCALGPHAEFLTRDHHRTLMPWGPDTPFCRLMDLDARLVGLGGVAFGVTPLHAVECLLYDEVPFFRLVFDGTIRYRWRSADGERGEHEFLNRIGTIKPEKFRRHYPAGSFVEMHLSNLHCFGIDARVAIERGVALGRAGVSIYTDPRMPRRLLPSLAAGVAPRIEGRGHL